MKRSTKTFIGGLVIGTIAGAVIVFIVMGNIIISMNTNDQTMKAFNCYNFNHDNPNTDAFQECMGDE